MAVAFRAVGSPAASATVTSISPTVSASAQTGDLLLAVFHGNNNQVVSPPASDNWTLLVESDNTSAQRGTIYWKICESDDPGASKTFTKPVDDNLLFYGVIAAYSGIDTADPFDAGTLSTSANGVADAITYATFDPSETAAFVVAVGIYAENGFSPSNVTGTNPTFAIDVNVQTGTGADAALLVNSGTSDGAATGSRTQATNAPIDGLSIGYMFGLKQAATVHAGAASITAAVTVAAAAILDAVAAAALSGVVTVAAVAGLLLPAETAVTGTGTVSGSVTADYAASSSVTGVATAAGTADLIEGGGVTHQATASVTATGTISGAATLDATATSSVSATGSAGGLAGLRMPGSANLSGSATTAGAVDGTLGASGALQGVGTASGMVTADYAARGSMIATASVTATAEGTVIPDPSIRHVATLGVARVQTIGAEVAFSSSRSLPMSTKLTVGAEVPFQVTTGGI